jgi:hypothetical protein
MKRLDGNVEGQPEEPGSAMSAALIASGPAPGQAAGLATFGRFVGRWECLVTFHHEDGRTERWSGEWTWSWILDGWAIQDVWRIPARSPAHGGGPGTGSPRGFGTTVRLYDPELDAWHVTWFGAVSHRPVAFLARQDADEIVMEAQGPGPARTRWIFSDVAADSFRWRNVSSVDEGPWILDQEMEVRRRAPDRAASDPDWPGPA